jgi:hypothetical protein
VWPKVVFCFLAGGSCVLDGLVRFFFFCFDMFLSGGLKYQIYELLPPFWT